MGKAVGGEKLQRPIGHWGLRWVPEFTQTLKNAVSPQWAVFLEQDLKHPAAGGRELQPLRGAGRFGRGHDIAHAMLVIMLLENLVGLDGSVQGQGSTDRAPEKRPQAQQFTLIF